jgi:hypothetical protein
MPLPAQTPAPAASAAANDYGKPETWLCRPGRTGDACAVDLSATIVTADGRLTREEWKGNPGAPIDCFYVYPTVSLDQTANSDMIAGPEERNVVRVQFARFASQCRPFAPLYRQATLTALRSRFAGKDMAADRTLAYTDVLDAWNHYLKNDNNGRGVVLIGHSQGSGVLMQLIRREIEGKPVQSQIVSALLLGTNVAVPKGKDVGGTFAKLPLCRAADQTGCVITYVSFRSTIPPPANSLFGRVADEGMEAACTNPAALGGGRGQLQAYLLAAKGEIASSAAPPPQWVTPAATITSPFVSVPGLLSAQCVSNENGSYLEVTVHGDPHDPRTDDISGDVLTAGKVNPSWGLHLIDVHEAIGNLVNIVSAQARAYNTSTRQ